MPKNKEKCPHCNVHEIDGFYAIVDREQGMYKTQPEELCKLCAGDMTSSCNSREVVKKIED